MRSRKAIKAADRGAAYLEATHLAGFSQAEAKRLFGSDPGLPEPTVRDYLTPWTAARAEKQFLARFNLLLVLNGPRKPAFTASFAGL